MSDTEILVASPLFDGDWYSARYPEVALSGLSPEAHFLAAGAVLRRDPGPGFCTGAYLDVHRDVAKSGMNPLVHYERHGRREGRKIFAPPPIAGPPRAAPAGFHNLRQLTGENAANDDDAAEAFKARAMRLYNRHKGRLSAQLVSILMPLETTGAGFSETLASVLGQTHEVFELLVLFREDAGGGPDLPGDDRIRRVTAQTDGRTAFWNAGLRMAEGRHIFYLTAGTVWDADHLAVMVTGLSVPEVECVLARGRPNDAGDPGKGGSGGLPDWTTADIGAFCHHAGLSQRLGEFDPALGALAEWDFILRYTRDGKVLRCPAAGLRIPRSEPVTECFNALPKLVRDRNHPGGNADGTGGLPSLNFAIKTHTSFRMRKHWGEYFFSMALQTSLEALGHTVRIDYPPTWYDAPEGLDDVVIVLRGREPYRPRPGEIVLLWVISHPDLIPYEEYDACDLVYVASHSYPALLSLVLGRNVYPLLQCSDHKAFPFCKTAPKPNAPGLFVGNSRNTMRPIIAWSVENFAEVRIFGQNWEKFIPPHLIVGEHVPNNKLANAYARAGFVLNDHWDSMKDFGIVSNRVFDVVGCGGRLVSDFLPAIGYLFGNMVRTVENAADFAGFLENPAPAGTPEARRPAADYVHAHHSFDARAAEMCRSIESLLETGRPAAPAAIAPIADRHRPRIGLLCDADVNGRPSAEAFVRLVCPLTTDAAQTALIPVPLNGADDPRLDGCDAVVVMAGAIGNPDDAARLADRLAAAGLPLYVDTGDPATGGRAADPARQILMAAARQIWCPAASSAGGDAATCVVPNRLDPRLWRTYPDAPAPDGPVRFLYLRSGARLDDPGPVYAAFAALEKAFPDQFELTVAAPGAAEVEAPWVRHTTIEGRLCSYPFLARHLMAMGRFDAGIAPMKETDAVGSDIRFLEYSALGAVTLASENAAFAEAAAAGLVLPCGPSPESWLERLTEAIEARHRFAELGDRARDHLWRHRNVLTWMDGPATLICA